MTQPQPSHDTLEKAIKDAGNLLPDGWRIELIIVNLYEPVVDLYGPDGEGREFWINRESLRAAIRRAIRYAIREERRTNS